MIDQLPVQSVVGIVAAFILQWLKKASWFPLLTARTDKIIQVVWSAGIAGASALAISISFDPAIPGRVILDGLTWSHVGNGLFLFLWSMLSQQLGYRAMIKPPERQGV